MMAAAAPAPRWPRVRAPGKVFLAGEYGVLAGGPALVMAVNRYATVEGEKRGPESPLEREGLPRLREALGRLPAGAPRVDGSAFQAASGEKLGLGSSAAWAAAAVGSALCALGEDLSDPRVRERAWQVGRAVHGGGGSGADVAASVLGGVVRFGTGGGLPRAEAVALEPRLHPLVLRGGRPVSTRSAIASLGTVPGRLLIAEAAAVGQALVDAMLAGADPSAEVREAAGLLTRIARAASLGAGAATEALGRAEVIARRFGGAAKPSGAGAGDLILVFVPELAASERPAVRAALAGAGLTILDLDVDAGGLARLEQP